MDAPLSRCGALRSFVLADLGSGFLLATARDRTTAAQNGLALEIGSRLRAALCLMRGNPRLTIGRFGMLLADAGLLSMTRSDSIAAPLQFAFTSPDAHPGEMTSSPITMIVATATIAMIMPVDMYSPPGCLLPGSHGSQTLTVVQHVRLAACRGDRILFRVAVRSNGCSSLTGVEKRLEFVSASDAHELSPVQSD